MVTKVFFQQLVYEIDILLWNYHEHVAWCRVYYVNDSSHWVWFIKVTVHWLSKFALWLVYSAINMSHGGVCVSSLHCLDGFWHSWQWFCILSPGAFSHVELFQYTMWMYSLQSYLCINTCLLVSLLLLLTRTATFSLFQYLSAGHASDSTFI